MEGNYKNGYAVIGILARWAWHGFRGPWRDRDLPENWRRNHRLGLFIYYALIALLIFQFYFLAHEAAR